MKLLSTRTALEASLRKLDGLGGRKVSGAGKRSALAGNQKYRGPGGETWTGRGSKPTRLAAALKDGKKIEDFLIAKGAHGGNLDFNAGRLTSKNAPRTPDEQAGMNWWNSISARERSYWLRQASSARPADAWKAYKLSQDK